MDKHLIQVKPWFITIGVKELRMISYKNLDPVDPRSVDKKIWINL